FFFFFSSRRRHTRFSRDWSSDVCSSDLFTIGFAALLFRDRPGAWQTVGIGVATAGLLMICGTVGYDFSVGAFAILMISPLSFARSEERRVGKEGRARWAGELVKEKNREC